MARRHDVRWRAVFMAHSTRLILRRRPIMRSRNGASSTVRQQAAIAPKRTQFQPSPNTHKLAKLVRLIQIRGSTAEFVTPLILPQSSFPISGAARA